MYLPLALRVAGPRRNVSGQALISDAANLEVTSGRPRLCGDRVMNRSAHSDPLAEGFRAVRCSRVGSSSATYDAGFVAHRPSGWAGLLRTAGRSRRPRPRGLPLAQILIAAEQVFRASDKHKLAPTTSCECSAGIGHQSTLTRFQYGPSSAALADDPTWHYSYDANSRLNCKMRPATARSPPRGCKG